MKDLFKEHHINDHVDKIYSEAIIVLDTNSILNLYRYSESNRKKYFEILKQVEKRLYLTHHICNEFYKNRLIIIENRSTFKETISELIEDNLGKLINTIKNSSGTDKYNSALSILKHETSLQNSILKELEKSSKNISTTIKEFKQDFDIKYIQGIDPILEEIVQIINKKVSKEIPLDEREKIFQDGEKRYKNEIPPGYKDNIKDSPEKFGDLVIWNELQALSKETKKPVLFISDDRKEDWAIKFKGYDLGPRKELIKEFYANTTNLFYSITTNKFIQIVSESYKITNTKKLQEETEIIQKNIQQKEFDVRTKNEEIRRTKIFSDEYNERINNTFKEIDKSVDYRQGIRNPLEAYNKSIETLKNITNPLREYNEMIERMKNPMQGYEQINQILSDNSLNSGIIKKIDDTQ